ncbi:MAG: right-handed parallel beta-helix repeat-containing protein [Gemmatimonadetes bacterium]|nr:right-handed parallel beta-helix repeat-containing protein [Gemmatimonadota bacterium]
MPHARISLILPALLLIACGGGAGSSAGPPTVAVSPGDDLQAILDTLRGPAVVAMAPGDYHLRAVPFTDTTCGNCPDPSEDVPATRGLLVRGRDIHLRAAGGRQVALHTHAGYGVLFDGCDSCSLEHVTVTDGTRDPDGRATDAGVVIRNGAVLLDSCSVRDNLGDSAAVQKIIVGVSGIVVREGGDATVRDCRVERNSWDGISGYRGARLVVENTVVDGVDKASGASSGGGRGVGIGLTWDARGTVRRTLVTRYWKGIGVFVNARAEITENIVEDVLTWGIADWGADGGHPVALIRDNAVFETGACGVLVDRAPDAPAESGDLVGNLFVSTGMDHRYDSGEPYCPQRPIARVAVPPGFDIEANLVFNARQPGDLPKETTLGDETFRARAADLLMRLATSPNLRASRFLGAFGPA